MSHATELEDDSVPELIYSVGIFPGIFALGEKLQISGKEAIEAFVIAWDIPVIGLAGMFCYYLHLFRIFLKYLPSRRSIRLSRLPSTRLGGRR
jgi:hypothetical protein